MTLHISRIEAFVFRAPITTPVQTSFGIMRDRPAVFVRVTDVDGVIGWGEIWCNFPTVGAEHRARLVDSLFGPLMESRQFDSPEAAFYALTAATEVLAIQCAEPGPIAQCIAGIDIALWDLHAKRCGQPLWKLLGGSDPRVPVYASGLNPTGPEKLAAERHAEGYRAFKLKVGFGAARDIANLHALRDTIGDCDLMVDANQGWDLATAAGMLEQLAPFKLRWLEEPLRADRPWSEWRALAAPGIVPLAAGENLASVQAFDDALAARVLGVVQPDLAKWGGFSGCLPVAKKILASGHRYCPHYLGAGIGLLASAHLLAAVGGDGKLEIDANPNPLRSLISEVLQLEDDGQATLNSKPGLGFEPDLNELAAFAVPFA